MLAASCLTIGFAGHMAAATDAAQSIRSMQWKRRVVLMSAADSADTALSRQRELLSSWEGAAERDVSIVEIVADRVSGASDTASDLRRRYDLRADRFMVVLIGKDGHVALRSTNPLSAEAINATIDAMPMRRSGQS